MLEIKLKAQGTKWRELEADDRLLVYQSDIQSRAPYAMAQNSSIFRDHLPVFFYIPWSGTCFERQEQQA